MAISGTDGFYATGRRKEATARVWVKPGSGVMMVNGRPLTEYFGRETSIMIINQPLQVLEQMGKVDMTVNVRGGGLSGQAGAPRVTHRTTGRSCPLTPLFSGR